MIVENISEFSRKIDYLTVRLPPSILLDRARELSELWETYSWIGLPFELVKLKDCPDNSHFKVVRIRDTIGNVIWQIKMKKEGAKMTVFDEISLQGAYFMWYVDKIPVARILDDLNVDIRTKRGVSRIDYRFDLRISSQKVWNQFFYPLGDEVKKRQDNGVTTWASKNTERITLCMYDKKLDIFENKAKKKFSNVYGEKVYKEYDEYKGDITRVEYRKSSRALRETKRTILEEMAYIENDAIKYIREEIGLILKPADEKIKYKKSKNEILLETKEREKIERASTMIEAYMKTLDIYGRGSEVQKILYRRYWLEIIQKVQDEHFKELIEYTEKTGLFIQ